MRKFISHVDFTLIFRLSLSLIMMVSAYTQSDKVAGAFGLLLAIYAVFSAKYKVGCGYNNCGYMPKENRSFKVNEEVNVIDYTEIK